MAACASVALAACGGGGGGSDNGGASGGSGTGSGGGPTPPSQSALIVSVSGPPGSVPSGRSTSLDLTIANSGTGAATDVGITSSLDPSISATSVTCQANGGAVCPQSPGTAMTLPSVPPGGTLVFHFALAIADQVSATLASTFHVSSDDVPGGKSQDITANIVATYSYVYVTATPPQAPVPVGGSAVYTATVTNAGPDAAGPLLVSHQFDPQLVLSSTTCQATGTTSCPDSIGATTAIPGLAVGDSLTFTATAAVTGNPTGRAADVVRLQTGDGQPIDNYNEVVANAFVYDSSAAAPNSVRLVSDPGELLGKGQTYVYTAKNAQILVSATGNQLLVNVNADIHWQGQFQLPASASQLQPGAYAGMPSYANATATLGGLTWISGNTCGSGGTMTIDHVAYSGSALASIDFRFDQACPSGGPLLHGTVHWNAADSTSPPGPWAPVPADLWTTADGGTPTSGNFIYLDGHIGDFVSNGLDTDSNHQYSYTQADSILSVNESAGHLDISVQGDEEWAGKFDVMSGQGRLKPGYYGTLLGYPVNNPANGGFSWFGDGRSCNKSTGWFVVDSVTYDASSMTTLDARFAQTCEDSFVPMHGRIHWDRSDTTEPPPPINPPPSGLWNAPANMLWPPGNYIYLESEAGDPIGNGHNLEVGIDNSTSYITLDQGGAALHLRPWAGSPWGIMADFEAMDSISQLQPGYYPNVTTSLAGNPTKGRMNWGMEGAGCNAVFGWFAIDDVTIINGTLTAIDLRFEQHCESADTPPLHGLLHWAQ